LVHQDVHRKRSGLLHSGKKKEESIYALKERIGKLEEIINRLDAAIFIYDLDSNRHIWTNGKYSAIIGYETEDISRIGLEEAFNMIHPDDIEIINKGIRALKTKECRSFSGIYRIKHKEGFWVWIYCIASIFQWDKNGNATHVLGLILDFSEHVDSGKHLYELLIENRRLQNELRSCCLTNREKEVIRHLAAGHSCKEIAHLLGISFFTVQTHIKNIHHKLGLKHLSAVITFAIENGLTI
jgi:PAS domain S-box-containing protein